MAWTNEKGFNFRSTVAYVTDGANQTYVVSDGSNNLDTPYPTTRTIDSDSVDFGWVSPPAEDGCRDRESGVTDVRLAGTNYRANDGSGQLSFRIDLPSAGAYEIRLAFGDYYYATNPYWQIVDNTTVLETVDKTASPTSGEGFYDATGVVRTSEALWTANNVVKEYTFASTVCLVRIATAGSRTGSTAIAHIGIKSVASTTTRPRWQNMTQVAKRALAAARV